MRVWVVISIVCVVCIGLVLPVSAQDEEEVELSPKQLAALKQLDADQAKLEAQQAEAQATVALKKAEFARIKTLVAKKLAKKTRLLEVLKELDQSTSKLIDAKFKLAQLKLKRSQVKSGKSEDVKPEKPDAKPKSPDKPNDDPKIKKDPDKPAPSKPVIKLATPKKEEPGKSDATKKTEPAKAEPVNDPRVIKLTMADGTVVTGRLSISALKVKTRFGELAIPIEELRSFKPGLNSRPAYKKKIDGLIKQLGDAVEPARRAAAAELLKIGSGVLPIIEAYRKDENTVRRSEIIKLVEELNEQIDDDGFEGDNTNSVSSLDQVSTTAFTMAGEILHKTFELESEFGKLTMLLADVIEARRANGLPEVFSRNLSLTDQNMPARGYKSSSLRVEKGDVVEIRADGRLSMTRWGSSAFSDPNGRSNYGWYVSSKIPNGALIYKIGTKGTVTKAGAKLKFTAKQAGTLYFGIAMTDRYARSNYRYPGTYKVKVRVTRK